MEQKSKPTVTTENYNITGYIVIDAIDNMLT